MWPSQRLASIGLDSRQRKSRARSKNRRGIRPIITLLEERTMLSTLNLTVTTLSDPSGPTSTVSLRQAINTANADTIDSQESINFAPGLHGTIDLTTALPNLANNISINGPGAALLTIQRDTGAAPFSIFTVNSGETVSISGMTITGGNAASGGGIFNYGGTLRVTNCTITDNTASGGSLYGNGEGYVTSSFYGGGAIYSTTGGAITIVNSTFTDNTTNGDGGGIYTSGTATVTNSVFTANEAACAGGIFNNGALTVNNSTFTNSTGAFYGGGIWNDCDDAGAGALYQYATLTVTNSTFSHNAVDGWCSSGGAIANTGTYPITVMYSTFTDSSTNGDGYGAAGAIGGNVTVSGSTFTSNTASNASGGGAIAGNIIIVSQCTFTNNTTSGDGGGILSNNDLTVTACTFESNVATNGGGIFGDGTMTINNTIVAGNTGYDISGQITGNNNLIGNSAGIANLPLNSSNLVGTTANPINPHLGPLQNNGGPTETMALLPGSPAIGAGSVTLAVDQNGLSLQYDQRGAGYPRTNDGTVDIGAYEHQLPTPTVSVVDNGGIYNGTTFTATATVNGQSSLEGVKPTLDYQQDVNGAAESGTGAAESGTGPLLAIWASRKVA